MTLYGMSSNLTQRDKKILLSKVKDLIKQIGIIERKIVTLFLFLCRQIVSLYYCLVEIGPVVKVFF